MKRLIIFTLLLSSVIIPTVIGEAASEKPQEFIKMGYEGISSNLTPAAKLMSGASALIIEGKDYRLGLKKDDALRLYEGRSRSPVLQAGAAAALVPFRSPSPQFSRNLLVTRDLGGFPYQTEPHLAVNPLDPEHLILGVIDYNAPNVVSYVSIDGGATWDGPFQPRYLQYDLGAGGDPVVAFDRNGKAYIASISIGFEEFTIFGIPFTETISSIAVSSSEDGGFTWERATSSSRSKVDLQMQLADQSGTVGTLALGFLDKPWMTVGPNPEDPEKDVIYVTYTHFVVKYEIFTVFGGGLFGFQNPVVETTIELVRSDDEGKTWSSPVAVSPTVRQVIGGAAAAEQFGEQNRVVQGSQPLVTDDGTLYVGWLDSTDDEAFRGLAEIWVARSDDGGETFSKPVVVTNFLEPDFSSRTAFFRSWGGSFPQMAAGPDGDISIVFVARPAGNPDDDGDVYYVRSDDGGRTWTRKQRVNDDDTNAFQFFPAVSVDPEGVVHVMWGDFRDDKSEKRYNIYYSKSEDRGETWIENSRVTDFPSNPNLAFPSGVFIGDYFAIESTEDDVYMVWADGRLGEFGVANQKIAFARLTPIRSSSIFLSPPSGAGGKDIVIQGFDFQPDQDIFIEVSGAVVSSGRTDLEGRFSMRVFVPISGEGAHDIRVFDASGNVATASFFMEFGFDTIEKRLQETVGDIKASIPSAPVTVNMTDTQSIVSSIRSVQDTLENRIVALEQGLDDQVGSLSTQIWIVAAIAVLATVISAYSLVTGRRLGGT